MKTCTLLVCVLVAGTVSAPAADKAIQELQRDIALLQQQVKDLQRSQDEKFAAVTELARQAIEAANRANTGVAVIQSNLDKSLRAQQETVVTPVVGLTTRMTEMSGRMDTLTQAVTDLTTLLNRMQAQLTDINNQVKTIQAPPIQPPNASQPQGGPGGTDANPAGGAAAVSNAPCMPATTLYDNALRDYRSDRSGKQDLALSEFSDYLRCYGNTEYAPNAQFYIAFIHYGQKNYEQAAAEFDTVLEKYSENNKTPQALLYKGKSLVQMPGHKTEGGVEFRELIKRYPRSDEARLACDELKGIGMNCPTTATSTPPKKGRTAKK